MGAGWDGHWCLDVRRRGGGRTGLTPLFAGNRQRPISDMLCLCETSTTGASAVPWTGGGGTDSCARARRRSTAAASASAISSLRRAGPTPDADAGAHAGRRSARGADRQRGTQLAAPRPSARRPSAAIAAVALAHRRERVLDALRARSASSIACAARSPLGLGQARCRRWTTMGSSVLTVASAAVGARVERSCSGVLARRAAHGAPPQPLALSRRSSSARAAAVQAGQARRQVRTAISAGSASDASAPTDASGRHSECAAWQGSRRAARRARRRER